MNGHKGGDHDRSCIIARTEGIDSRDIDQLGRSGFDLAWSGGTGQVAFGIDELEKGTEKQ